MPTVPAARLTSDVWQLALDHGATVDATAVIIATGVTYRRLDVGPWEFAEARYLPCGDRGLLDRQRRGRLRLVRVEPPKAARLQAVGTVELAEFRV